MGHGFVYWIMMLNMATSSGWLYLTSRNWKMKRVAFTAGCFVLMLYFLLVSYIHYNAYVVVQEKFVYSVVLLRFITGGLGLSGTVIFVLVYPKYYPKK